MSIPPLVCSTPPPPDQCDDDKEHDDFDIDYNLSQDEDDEKSDYVFCTFNNTSSSGKTSLESSIIKDNILSTDISHIDVLSNACESDIINERNITVDEDTNIEDLDLQLEQVSINNEKRTNDKDVADSAQKNQDKNSVITDPNLDVFVNVTTESSPTLSSGLDSDFTETVNYNEENDELHTENLQSDPDNENCSESHNFSLEEQQKETVIKLNEQNNIENDINIVSEVFKPENISENVFQNVETEVSIEPKDTIVFEEDNSVQNEEFDDFDDFKFSNNFENNTTLVNVEDINPWENEECSENVEEFNANFDDIKYNEVEPVTTMQLDTSQSVERVISQQNLDINEDDDFGDFDNFKSSSATISEQEVEVNKSSCSDAFRFTFDLADNETQSIENVNRILKSVFEEEIDINHEKYDKMLESSLCETWGYLLETEIRQPYMVNWNNSLGQKTLLKALCIDSRNILFGPKWNQNMPRYAVNLGAIPLQPQPTCASHTENMTIEKPSNTSDTWADPFNTNTQEFTYAEALLLDLEHLMATLDQMAHNHSSLKISDLLSHACTNESSTTSAEPRGDDFATTLSNSDKVYPNTLNIQPIRQINLPDTHIFTPTDSEIPRSKTIHYNNTMLDTQTSTESKDKPCGITSNAVQDDNEYSDFQDFKGVIPDETIRQTTTPKEVSTSTTSNDSLPNVSLQTRSILQPIKVEPIMPVLNWPDPGQVKETFDDFSEFISSTSWCETETARPQNQVTVYNEMTLEDNQINVYKDTNNEDDIPTKEITTGKEIDDEFDKFQSASSQQLPNISNINEAKNTDQFHISSQMKIKNETEVPSSTAQWNNETYTSNIPNMFDSKGNLASDSAHTMMGTQILQPTPAVTSKSMHPTAQILQPLSLESISQINWPNPGIDLQDLSRFNPVEKVHSIQTDASTSNHSKGSSPIHSNTNHVLDDDGWGDFVSSKPKQHISPQKKPPVADDDEWSDFVSSPIVRPHNGLNTISFNVHTNNNMQKSLNQINHKKEVKQVDIPTLNYVTPKATNIRLHGDQHFQNL